MDATAYFYLAIAFMPSLGALVALSLTGFVLSAIAATIAVFAAQSSFQLAGVIWLGAWVLAAIPVAIADSRRRAEYRHREMLRELRATKEAIERQQASAGQNGQIVYGTGSAKKSWWGR